MTNEMRKARMGVIRTVLFGSKAQAEFAAALRSARIRPDQVARMAYEMVERDPRLVECSAESICASIVAALHLGLEPNPNSQHVHLIPHGDKCAMVVGYRGYVQLMYNTGNVLDVNACIVRINDQFMYDAGQNTLSHKPMLAGDRGDLLGAYCRVEMVGGGVHIKWMRIDDIMAIRDAYSASWRNDREHSMWETHSESMVLKTVVRAATNMLPSSPTLERGLEVDRCGDGGLAPDMADFADEVPDEDVFDDSVIPIGRDRAARIQRKFAALDDAQRKSLRSLHDRLPGDSFEGMPYEQADELEKTIDRLLTAR